MGFFCKYMISSKNAAIALFVVRLGSLVRALFVTAIFWISLIMVQNGKLNIYVLRTPYALRLFFLHNSIFVIILEN